MWTLMLIEIRKMASRPRSYISFAAVTLIISIIQLALYADGESYIGFITQSMEQSFTLQGKLLNGNLVCFIILQMLIVQIPLLIALVTGDMISGEAAMGTLRLLSTKPISRTKILLSKFIAGCVYILLLLVWLAFLSWFISRIIFGDGDLIVLKSDGITILQAHDLIWRFAAAFAMAFLALAVVAALSLMLSVFSDNSIGPIVSTMAVIILFTIIGTMDVPLFDKIKPFLFTTHMIIWRNFFDQPLNISQILQSVFILLLHIFILTGVAIKAFNKKDILS